jgi:hypothetical protein
MAKKPPAAKSFSRQRDPEKVWSERLVTANKQYDLWAKEFEVKRLEQYYNGKHWRGLAETDAQKKYTINLIFATVETQLPSLLFSRPRVSVDSRPDHQQTANSDAAGRATLIEHTLQTQIDDPKLHFGFLTTLALRDAYPGYGVVEVGYTADWIDNPNAEKPILKDDNTPMTDKEGVPVKQPAKVLRSGTKEQLFIKHIPFETVRVSPGRNLLEHNDWIAYYEWHYVEDVKRNPAYTNTDGLNATGRVVSEGDDTTTDDPDRQLHTGMVKIWKIWDLRLKVRHVLADGHKQLLQEGQPYTYCNLAVLKFYERRNAFYPLPPIFNWLSPQDEKNELREMARNHRRRAVRRYMREPGVAKTEFEKLETGEDMTCIEVPRTNPSPIMPIPDAPLDAQFSTLFEVANKDDFTQITGVSGEARGMPEATTATQANIVNVRAQVRESRARLLVAEWLAEIARLMLLTIRDKMQLPFMVKQSVDPFSFTTDPKKVLRTAAEWKQISTQDIADLDVDVKIDVASLSPVAEDAQRQTWNIVLTLLTNQALLMVLMTPLPEAPTEPSPLLRKTLALNGIKSDAEVREIWRVGQVILQRMVMMAMAAAAAKSGNPMGGMMPSEDAGAAAPPGVGPGPTTGSPTPAPALGA